MKPTDKATVARRSVKLEWKGNDGATFTTETEINGTEDEIRSYFVGVPFNVGRNGSDYFAVVQSLTFTN